MLWLDDPANAAEAVRFAARGGSAPISAPPPFAWEGLREMIGTRRDAGLLRGAADPHRFADDSYYLRAVARLNL